VEATLSRQPGDNFKVVADCDPASDYFGGAAKQNDAASARVLDSTGGFVPGTNITDLLTVWRTLHIEVDSMVVFDPAINKVNGNIVEFSASSQGTAVSLLDTDVDPYDGSNHPGRFDMGTLKIGNPPEKTITPIIGEFTNGIHLSAMDISILPLSFSAIDEDNFDNGTMSGTVTEITRSGNDYVYTLNITANNENPIDWPDFVGGNISVAGGAGQEILVVNSGTTQVIANGLNLPFELMDDDTATMPYGISFDDFVTTAYQQAYIRVVPDGGGTPSNNKQTVPFKLNVPDAGVNLGPIRNQDIKVAVQATNGIESHNRRSRDYWIGYVQFVYQSAIIEDSDPEHVVGGWTPGDTPKMGSIIMIEQISDILALCPGVTLESEVKYVSAHEIGHQFDLNHVNGGIMSPMCSGIAAFTPPDLDLLRRRINSPGQ